LQRAVGLSPSPLVLQIRMAASLELAETVLATANSLQGLEDTLDKISLHSGIDSPRRARGRQHRDRSSPSSSNRDSAIGSLHTTTDEESPFRQRRAPHRAHTHSSPADWDWLYQTDSTPKLNGWKKIRHRKHHENATSIRTIKHKKKTLRHPALELIRRDGSMSSLSSTDSCSSSNSSQRSSRIVETELLEEDIVQLARFSSKLERRHSTIVQSDVISIEHPTVVHISLPQDEDSDSSASTVVAESHDQPGSLHMESLSLPVPNSHATVTPKVSFREQPKERIPPKRTNSFLQRIKLRRVTSFKTERKKRMPVRRSMSDRVAYQIKRGLIDYKQDTDFIGKPSQMRRIGRMIDKQAGRFHIVQLHRPPSGRFGIYINQSTVRRGIFISRFADAGTAKFYSGLLAPGDEIVKVNTVRVKGKSVDYVYNILSELDSAVFTIVPVNSRPDW